MKQVIHPVTVGTDGAQQMDVHQPFEKSLGPDRREGGEHGHRGGLDAVAGREQPDH